MSAFGPVPQLSFKTTRSEIRFTIANGRRLSSRRVKLFLPTRVLRTNITLPPPVSCVCVCVYSCVDVKVTENDRKQFDCDGRKRGKKALKPTGCGLVGFLASTDLVSPLDDDDDMTVDVVDLHRRIRRQSRICWHSLFGRVIVELRYVPSLWKSKQNVDNENG